MSAMDLRTRAIKSTAWYIGTRVWIQALAWGVTIALARLLTPADYGLFAMALAVITLLELFQEFGLGVAIVQRQTLTRPQLNAIFWITSGASLVLVTAAWLGAPLAARFYAEPRLTWMVRLLGLTFLLNALGLVPYNLLTREIDFRRRSLAEAAGVLASSAVAITLASLGYGVWALVLGQVVRTAVRNAGMALLCRWVPTLAVSFDGMGDILGFGLRIAGSVALGSLSGVVNTAIIGRFLGGHDLGLYGMASALGESNPLHKLSTQAINQLSLPVFSKLQDQEELLRRYFLKITKYLALIAVPGQIGMALVARDLVVLLLSERWIGSIHLIEVLAVGGVFYVLPLPSAPVLTSRGRAQALLRFSAVLVVVLGGAILVGAQFSITGVVLAYIVAFPALRLYLLSLALAELSLSARAYAANIAAPLAATGVMAAAVLAAQGPLTRVDAVLPRLALEVALGAAAYAGSLLLIDRGLGTEMKGIVQAMVAGSRA